MTHTWFIVKRSKKLGIFIPIILLLTACNLSPTMTPSVVPSKTSATPPASETLTPKKTKSAPDQQSLQTWPGGIAPYPDAPLCPDSGESHDNSIFHTLWDDMR